MKLNPSDEDLRQALEIILVQWWPFAINDSVHIWRSLENKLLGLSQGLLISGQTDAYADTISLYYVACMRLDMAELENIPAGLRRQGE